MLKKIDMKYKEVYKQIEVVTHAEKVLKAELDAVLIVLYEKRPERYLNKDEIQADVAMRSAAKNLEDSLNLLLTHRKYLENPENYKLKTHEMWQIKSIDITIEAIKESRK